jgi:hypothetical protein
MTETPMIFNRRRLLSFAAASGTAPELISTPTFAWPARHHNSTPAPRNPLGTTNYVNPINCAPTSPPPSECEGVDT